MGKRYYDVFNERSADSYSTIDTKLVYEKKDWKLELYATNLLNKEYIDFMIATPNHNIYHFGDPRMVGVKVYKTF